MNMYEKNIKQYKNNTPDIQNIFLLMVNLDLAPNHFTETTREPRSEIKYAV